MGCKKRRGFSLIACCLMIGCVRVFLIKWICFMHQIINMCMCACVCGESVPVTDPALVAHGSFAVAAVDVQCGGRLVQTGDGAAGAQFDHLIADVPQLEPLQQVDVGHVPVFL